MNHLNLTIAIGFLVLGAVLLIISAICWKSAYPVRNQQAFSISMWAIVSFLVAVVIVGMPPERHAYRHMSTSDEVKTVSPKK